MQKIISALLVLSIMLFSTGVVYTVPGVSALSAIVIDSASGRVLYEKDAHTQRGMASTTKIMTFIVALEYGDLSSVAKISPAAANVEGSSMYLAAGEEIIFENLLYGLMLVSGNDAATAIAEHVGGDVQSFVNLMNEKALEIGAKNTHFDNPHGLASDEHYTTAYDLAKITAYGMKNPKFREVVSTKTKQIPWSGHEYNRSLTNHNKMLRTYEGCIGVKTGFTKATGRCLVSAAEKNSMTFISVTLGAPDDWNDHTNMLNYAFDEYKPFEIAKNDTFFGNIKIKNGTQESTTVVAGSDFYFPAKTGEESRIETTQYITDKMIAPIKERQQAGYISVLLDGKEYGNYPIVVSNEIPRKRIILIDTADQFAASFRKTLYMWVTTFHEVSLDS